jgi:hypothetical protein
MPEEKRQQYLLLVLLIVIFGGAIWFLWPKFKPELPPPVEPQKPEKIDINFQFLESPALKELQPFEEIPSPPEEIGRENPFIPY